MTGIETGLVLAGHAVTVGDAFAALSTIAGLAGAVQQSQTQRYQGQIAQQNAQAQAAARQREAEALEQRAGQERAIAQRDAIEERRQARLASSRGVAVAAASGAGALDPGVVDLLGDLEAEGEYRAQLAIAGGEERARGAVSAADARRYEADTLLRSGVYAKRIKDREGSNTILGGVGTGLARSLSLFEKYG